MQFEIMQYKYNVSKEEKSLLTVKMFINILICN